jgi:hypothetical protein
MQTLDFLGLGAQKAGTSWIHACLYEHPQIVMPATKEIHFFSNHYANGLTWYAGHFQDRLAHQVIGEFSPTYLYHPDAPKRIHAYNPHVKLLICLREPVARTLSAYRYAMQTGAIPPTMTLDTLIEQYPAYVEHSLYSVQIERYLHYFKRDQLLIMLYEDIASEPFRFMQDIYQFVGVDPSFRSSMAERKVNASRGIPRIGPVDTLIKQLAAALRQAGLAHLTWVLGRSRFMEAIRRLNTRPPASQPLSARQQADLQRLFAPDIRALSELLQRDLHEVWSDDKSLASD